MAFVISYSESAKAEDKNSRLPIGADRINPDESKRLPGTKKKNNKNGGYDYETSS